MSPSPNPPCPTLAAADAALEAEENARPPRRYLGMSQLGHECERYLWYSYHTPQASKHDAATLKRFADGHASEAVIIERLKRVPGLKLLDRNPETGEQWALSAFDGRLRGHMDGAVVGLLDDPQTWFVFEAKSTAEKRFNALQKIKERFDPHRVLKEWNATYYAQAQLYMGYSGMQRHWTVVCTPGVRDWLSVHTPYDQAEFERMQSRAERILNAKVPLARISNNPAWHVCKMCQRHSDCFGGT